MSARGKLTASSLASQLATSNPASSSIDWLAAGLANRSPIGGAISAKVGVAVSARAPSSAAQPDATPPVVTSLRYPADPTLPPLANARIGETELDVASLTR